MHTRIKLKVIFWLVLLLGFLCVDISICAAKKNDTLIAPIKILKTDFRIIRYTPANCDNFFSSFLAIDTVLISDKATQQKVLDLIRASDTTFRLEAIDTRAKMYLYFSSGRVDSICLGLSNVFSINNRLRILRSHDLIDLVAPMYFEPFPEDIVARRIHDSLLMLTVMEHAAEAALASKEQDSLDNNPLHCYMLELVLQNLEVMNFLGIDTSHYEKAALFNGENYLGNCTIDERYAKVRFSSISSLSPPGSNINIEDFRPCGYITYFGWDKWEHGFYCLSIYKDKDHVIEIYFRNTNDNFAIDHIKYYDLSDNKY